MPPLDTPPLLGTCLDASSAHGAALAKVAPWPHARDFFCPTAFDASSAHGAALALVAPWPHARDFFCSTAFAHCRPFKPVSCANFALGRIWNLPDNVTPIFFWKKIGGGGCLKTRVPARPLRSGPRRAPQ